MEYQADAGDADAVEQAARILEPSPAHRQVALYAWARAAYLRADLERAVRFAEQLAAIDRRAQSLNLLGTIRAARGEHVLAREAFEASLAMVPRDAAVLTHLGTIALRTGDPAAAAERFRDALFVDPAARAAREGLAATR